MAAPVATVRVPPTGNRLLDGYQSLISFFKFPLANVFEIEVGVPGLNGGEPVNTTTMHNLVYRTKSPQTLIEMTPFDVLVAYDPAAYADLAGMTNVNDQITVTWPNGSTLAFWGYLQDTTFQQLVMGTMPQATLHIVPTNWDDINCEEANPVLNAVGTC